MNTLQWRILLTLLNYVGYISLGISTAMVGPSLLSLELHFSTSITVLGQAMMLMGLGSLGGAMLCGALFDNRRFPKELQMGAGLLVEAVAIMLAPLWNIYTFFVIMGIRGLSNGFLFTTFSAYIINLWTGHKAKPSIVLSSYIVYLLGCIMGPVTINPFLTDGDPEHMNHTNSSQPHSQNTTDIEEFKHELPITYGYMLVGCILFLSSLFHVFPTILNKMNPRIPLHNAVVDNVTTASKGTHNEPLLRKLTYLVPLCLFCFSVMVHSTAMAAFTSTVAVKGFGWSVKIGSLLTALYWTATALGMFLNTFLLMCFPLQTLFIVFFTIALPAQIFMLFVYYFGFISMIISVSLANIALGPSAAMMSIWISKRRQFTGMVAAVCSIGLSVGKMFAFSFVGSMIDHFGPMSFLYTILSAVCLMIIWFVVLNVVFKRLQAKHEPQEMEAMNS